MGPLDSFVDYYFCGGVKKLALDTLYDLSKNSTLLNVESRKPEAEQRRDLIEQYQGEIDICQKLLEKLMPGGSIEFCLKEGQPHERDLSYLIYRDKDSLCPAGIPLYATSSSIEPNQNLASDTSIPTFAALADMQPADLNQIRISGKFSLDNQIFYVQFTHEREPILMCYETTAQMKLLQSRLSNLWINSMAQQKLISLAEIHREDSTLKLTALFLGLGSGDDYSEKEEAATKAWKQISLVIQDSFDKAIQRMQGHITVEKNRLAVELEQLLNLPQSSVKERKKLAEIQIELDNLIAKQNKLNKNIVRFKKEFTSLCHMISYCNALEMVTIFTIRITNFLDFIARLSESPMGEKELAEFNAMLAKQSEFLKHFGPEQTAICAELFDPPESDRTRSFGIIPPTSDLHRNDLRQLLTDPTRSLEEIELAMKQLKIQQEILLSNKIKQLEFGKYLDQLIKEKVYIDTGGKYSSGLNCESGLTYFTPQTYSRIVLLKKLRDDLLNTEIDFTHEQIEIMGAKISHHFKKIAEENRVFMEKQKSIYFASPVTNYAPVKDEYDQPIDHDEWVWRFEVESYKEKTGAIISGLREVHTVTMANIDALIRRGDRISTVTPKIDQFHENTKAFKKASMKLRREM